jgi:dCMP deaminase
MISVNRKDKQFMDLCSAASKIFSTCIKRKYCAVLVDDANHIIGFGYNGGPSGFVHCQDGGCPRAMENSPNGSSYDNCIATHAEANALLHSDYSAAPTKLYVNGPPCFSCAKLIANSTVKTVYYLSDSNYRQWDEIHKFLNRASVQLVEVY